MIMVVRIKTGRQHVERSDPDTDEDPGSTGTICGREFFPGVLSIDGSRTFFMVGWGFAFGRGIVIFLWSIVWAIVAGIIAVLITGGTLAGVISDPGAVASNPTGFLAAFFLGIFLSVLFVTIVLYVIIGEVVVEA